MFEQSPDKTHLTLTRRCQSCGRDVTIEIHHLESGYGLLGGVIYQPDRDLLIAKCERCYRSRPNLVAVK
jgi:hypothetical protein